MSMRLLRGLGGRTLPCGCLAGIYETYDGLVVTMIDAKSGGCGDSQHHRRAVVPAVVPAALAPSARTPGEHQAGSRE